MILNPQGLVLVEEGLQEDLRNWDQVPRGLVDLEGTSYNELFSKKSKD